MGHPINDVDNGEHVSFDAPLAARICWYYFKEGQTQDAIAQRVGLTRKRVNRILNDARETGFVQITIRGPVGPCVELENQLVGRYGLRQALVAPAPASDTDVRAIVGAAAGQYISDQLPPSGCLGISWGGTIRAAAQNLTRRSGLNNTVVLLCGGLAESTSANPYDNAAMFARALAATCYYVTAPMFAETQELRDALVQSEPIKRVLSMVRHLDIALLSAIDLSMQSKALEYGVISSHLCQSLRDSGAVGDICGHYLDADGHPVEHPVEHPIAARMISPDLDHLRRVPRLVLAAGGKQKVPITRSAIRAGLCHVLITDEDAAQDLLRS